MKVKLGSTGHLVFPPTAIPLYYDISLLNSAIMPHTKDGPPSLAAQFISLWSYLSILLAGSFVFLPRSSTKLFGDDRRARQITSADRPEHPFLTPLTADPTATMLSDVTGMLICMMWWGGYVKRWMNPSASTNKSTAITQAMRNERMKAFGVVRPGRQDSCLLMFLSVWPRPRSRPSPRPSC